MRINIINKRGYLIIIPLLLTYNICIAQNVEWVIKPKYDAISRFCEGVAAVRINGKWGYVNENGVELVKPEYDAVCDFSDGVGVITSADKSVVAIADINGKINKPKGNFKIDSRFSQFSDGLLLVSDGKKWGYLNRSGDLSMNCKYVSAQPFSENLAAVLFDEQWYYISTDGTTVIPPNTKKNSYWALGFNEGKAIMLYNNGMVCIDVMGKEVNYKLPKVTPPTDAVNYKQNTLPCKEGELIFDSKSRVLAFIDKKGIRQELFANPDSKQVKVKPDGNLTLNGKNIPYNDKSISWHNKYLATIQTNGGKYGVVALRNKSIFQINLPSDTIGSIFGNPAELKFLIKNSATISIDTLVVTLNAETTKHISDIKPNTEKALTFLLPKEPEIFEQSKEIEFFITEYCLLLGTVKKKIVIKDIPSIRIEFQKDKKIIVKPNEKCHISFDVINEAKVDAKALIIRVNNFEPKTINVSAESRVKCVYDMDSYSLQRPLQILIKPLNSPEIKNTVNGITLEKVGIPNKEASLEKNSGEKDPDPGKKLK